MGNKHYGRLRYSCVKVGDVFKVRMVRYLHVGGSRCAVIRAVGFLCAEWLR
jgi:hypothetical protein